MAGDNTHNLKTYQLTESEQKLALGYANAVSAAKLGVYEANVALESAQARVRNACREVEGAEQSFAAAVGFLARSHDIALGRISADFKLIEEVKQ